MPGAAEKDAQIRLAAFEWLQDHVDIHGDVLPRVLLQGGFTYEGRRVPFQEPQGIFKPAVMPELPLSITTAPDGPYDDSFTESGLLSYRYRGTDPGHRDNVGLREAGRRQVPLIYFHGVATGRYLAVWLVFIVGDDPEALTFTVAADDAHTAEDAAVEAVASGTQVTMAKVGDEAGGRRAYITASVRVRLHQRGFRERVLQAYRDQCALCKLRHRDLLDAAHIIPDRDPEGMPVVTNGLSLCKIHHAAFDHVLIGIRPDYRVEVHPRILKEQDGPMLRHGLQGMHGTSLVLPRSRVHRPDRDRLAERYEKFRTVA